LAVSLIAPALSGFPDFFALSARERIFFLEAAFLQLWAGLVLKLIPFRWIPRFFANPQNVMDSPQSPLLSLIKESVRRAENVSPWKNRCLVSSLAARCMLRRRRIGSSLSLGMAKEADGRMTAHAWLTAGDIEIVERGGDYKELFYF
jgi:hypothetical protein